MTLATPYSVLKTQGIVLRTPNATEGRKTRGKSPLLDMVFANCPATESANRSGLILTVNALHAFDIVTVLIQVHAGHCVREPENW